MVKSNVGKIRRWAAAAAMALVVVGSGAANAAVFTTNWDPLFNPLFFTDTGVNLGWKGTASIDVDSGCVTPSTTVTFPTGCGAASLIGYGFTLYNTLPGNVLYTGGAAGNLSPDPNAVRFDAFGVVDGFTLPGVIILSGSPFVIGGISFAAELDFIISGPYTGPRLKLTGDICDDGCIETYFSDTSGAEGPYKPIVRWTQVPEPATLVLVGLALFAAGAARRRC